MKRKSSQGAFTITPRIKLILIIAQIVFDLIVVVYLWFDVVWAGRVNEVLMQRW